MPAPTITEFLKYANLQMAAEALYGFDATSPGVNLTPGETIFGEIASGALEAGNLHASRFAPTEAAKFAAQWTIEQHISNTETGFSGALFKNKATNELVLSFRSTEFIDDAARDNEATNVLEIKEKGWAFGQLSDMEAWYQKLKFDGLITGPLTVTGYSLGGHLATAFNLMHDEYAPGSTTEKLVKQAILFNGAGVGTFGSTPPDLETLRQRLTAMIGRFRELRDAAGTVSGLESLLRSNSGKSTYQALRTAIAATNGVPDSSLNGIVQGMRFPGQPLDGNEQADFDLLVGALDRALRVKKEARRVPTLRSGGSEGPQNPANIQDLTSSGALAVAGESVDYQMAVISAATEFNAKSLTLLGGLNGALGDRTMGSGAPLANQWDLAGTEISSTKPLFMVAHSQYRYGQEFQLFIEDQPLTRGSAVWDSVKTSMSNFAIKLLVDNYVWNDFGDTHSLVLIVDSLNVQDTLLQLVPVAQRAAAGTTLNDVLKAASYLKAERNGGQGKAEGDVLENAVNALADLVLGPGNATTLRGSPAGNTWATAQTKTFQVAKQDYTGRDTFYAVLKEITDSPAFNSLAGQLALTPSGAGLANVARSDFGAFAALYSLSPFAFSAVTQESTLESIVEAAWGDTYSSWLEDKNSAANQGGHTLFFSDDWLSDRARFLERKNWFNSQDRNPFNPSANYNSGENAPFANEATFYLDLASGYKIRQGGLFPNAQTFAFGDDERNVLIGQSVDDRLYGGGGDDELIGGKGDDRMEGGEGSDKYRFASGDGADIVLDSDGEGTILRNDSALSAGAKFDGFWKSLDGTIFRKVNADKDLEISFVGGDKITVRSFDFGRGSSTSGYLGVRLLDRAVAIHEKRPADNAAPANAVSIDEGGLLTMTARMPFEAGPGGQRVKFVLSGTSAEKFTAIDDEIDLGSDGEFVFTIPEGQREITFQLQAAEDVDADESLTLSAQLIDEDGELMFDDEAQVEVALDATDEAEPATTREIRGDWAPKAFIDPITGATYYQYDTSYGNFLANQTNIIREPGVPNTQGFQEPDLKLDGGEENDHIVTGDYDEVAYGYAGDDVLEGAAGHGEVLFGGAGNDWLEAGGYDDHAADYFTLTVNGRTVGLGENKLHGGAGDDYLFGGWAEDTDALYDDTVLPTGLPGDWSAGGSGDDHVFGGAGNDVLQGGGGADFLLGGAGRDVLLGDDDLHLGGGGTFWTVLHPLFGTGGGLFSGFEFGLFPVVNASLANPDLVFDQTGDPDFTYYRDGGGDDVLIGGAGQDILIGQAGSDTLYGGDDADIEAGWEGNDFIYGGDGDDLIAGDFGRWEQENQRGVDGVNLVRAGVFNVNGDHGDVVDQSGSDFLDGGAGNDALAGRAGTDAYRIYGGMGEDTVTDGEGGEANVLALAPGMTVAGLRFSRVGDALQVRVRGAAGTLTVQDYYTRAQDWTIRDAQGNDTALADALAQPDPNEGNLVAQLREEARKGQLARVGGAKLAAGWTPLGGNLFQGNLDRAYLAYASQRTTETFTSVDTGQVLGSNTTEDTQDEVLAFGTGTAAHLDWDQHRLETLSLASDAAVIDGPVNALPRIDTTGEAVVTLRREQRRYNEQHTANSTSGGVVSYDTGTEVLLATVTYDTELHAWNQFASKDLRLTGKLTPNLCGAVE